MRWSWLVAVVGVWACSGQNCGTQGFQQRWQGAYTGAKFDTAGAVRLSQQGFAYLNSDAGVSTVLALLAPGGAIRVPIPCSVQTTSIVGIPVLRLVIGDEGALFCTDERCGLMDGKCTADDVAREVVITPTSLTFRPKTADIVEAEVTARVETGELHISSENRTGLCLLSGGGPIKCAVDFNTTRTPPAQTRLGVNIKLGIDTRWDRLLTLEVADIDGVGTCTGSARPPDCIDADDIVLARPAGASCRVCSDVNFAPIKQLLISQLADSLKNELNRAIAGLNCAACGPGGTCPQPTVAGLSAMCVGARDGGGGLCVESGRGKCVPGLVGSEGRLDVGAVLAGLAPAGSSVDFSIGLGGATSATTNAGATVGLRGGLREVSPARCVVPQARSPAATVPLPEFDVDAPPNGYDVAFSLSQQVFSEALYRFHQSGAFCLEVGSDAIPALESSVLATLLPTLGRLTFGRSVPLRVVLRPVQPPSVSVGRGTVPASGQMKTPLLTMDWPGLEIDLYALVEDRMVRLLTIAADLKLPMGLEVEQCDQLKPTLGALRDAVQKVSVKNNELLAEDPQVLAKLVPQLLALAEPQLAAGFPAIALPALPQFAFKIQLLGVRGVGSIPATGTFQHLGVYARLYPREQACPMQLKTESALFTARFDENQAHVGGLGTQETAFRVDEGFWSPWQESDGFGYAPVTHERLRWPGRHVIELKGRDGRWGRVEVFR
jgi:hypothetical protein